MKLTSAPEATAASLLPPKQRIKLFQPRTKLEQFEDILLESQLLEASLATGNSPNLAEMVSVADSFMTSSHPESLTLPGLPIGPDGYPGMAFESIDFDTDVIFGDKSPSELNSYNKNDISINVDSQKTTKYARCFETSSLTKGEHFYTVVEGQSMS